MLKIDTLQARPFLRGGAGKEYLGHGVGYSLTKEVKHLGILPKDDGNKKIHPHILLMLHNR